MCSPRVLDLAPLLRADGPCAPQRLAWLVFQLFIPVAAVGCATAYLRREASTFPVLPGDVQWTPKSSVTLPRAAALVGLVAGLLGLGGGELMAPLLLVVGMLPQVAPHHARPLTLTASPSSL